MCVCVCVCVCVRACVLREFDLYVDIVFTVYMVCTNILFLEVDVRR